MILRLISDSGSGWCYSAYSRRRPVVGGGGLAPLAEARLCVCVWQAEDAAKMKGYEGEIEAIKKAMATFQE